MIFIRIRILDPPTTSATRVEGLTAENYLRESIINPNDYIVEDFIEDAMPQNFGRDLTSEQITDPITYLLTLK